MLSKVLCETEIALLSEDEKSLYQKQQKEYREREVFVNRLEQLDRVVMPKVKPKRFAVKCVKPVEFNAVTVWEKKSISQPEQLESFFSAVNMKHCIPAHIDEYQLTSLPRVCVDDSKRINWEEKSYEVHRTVIPKVIQPRISCELESNTEITELPAIQYDYPNKIELFLPGSVAVSVTNTKVVAEAKKIKFSCEPYQIATTEVLKKQAPEVGYELLETMLEAPSCKSIAAPKIEILANENSELKITGSHGKAIDVPEIKASVCNAKVEKVRKVYYQCPEVKCEELTHTTVLPDILVVSPEAREISQEPIVISRTKFKSIIPVSVSYNKPNGQIAHTEKPNIQIPVDSEMKCSDTLNTILIRLKG